MCISHRSNLGHHSRVTPWSEYTISSMSQFKKLIICALIGIVSYGALLIIMIVVFPYGFSNIEYSRVPWKREPLRSELELIRVTFTSPDQNLGIVQLPLVKSYDPDSVPILFKVEDAATNQTMHQQIYQSSVLTNASEFPFGLPAIKNSLDRKYALVLQMMQTGTKLSIVLDTSNQYVASIHQYDKAQLKGKITNMMGFILTKVSTTHQKAGWSSLIVLAISCLAYPFVLQYFAPKQTLRQTSDQTIFAQLVQSQMVIVLMLVPNLISDGVYAVWFLLYLLLSYFGGISLRSHYLWALILLVASPFLLLLSEVIRAENASVLAFFLLCTGVGMETVRRIKSAHKSAA